MGALKESDIELIERYISGDISEADKLQVEDRVKDDMEFAGRLKMMKTIFNRAPIDSDSFREELDSIFDEYEVPETNSFEGRKKGRSTYLIAASVTLLVAFSVWIIFMSRSPTSQSLYTQNFEIPAENITVRDEGTLDSDILAAINAYRDGDFSEAANYFEQYLDNNPSDVSATFYLGISYLAEENAEGAIKYLDKVIKNGDSIYTNSAYWYQALAFLWLNDIDRAIKNLEVLQESDSTYSKRAAEIIKALNEG